MLVGTAVDLTGKELEECGGRDGEQEVVFETFVNHPAWPSCEARLKVQPAVSTRM